MTSSRPTPSLKLLTVTASRVMRISALHCETSALPAGSWPSDEWERLRFFICRTAAGGCRSMFNKTSLARKVTHYFARWTSAISSVFGVICFEPRSEEHTSDLQSRENLVCRLLLEKKK